MRAACLAAPIAAALIGSAAAPEPEFLTVRQRDRLRSAADPSSASLSADGRYLALTSFAPLTALDTDVLADVYVVELSSGAVTLESTSAEGLPIDSDCARPRISADGTYVVFEALADPAASPAVAHVILRDRSRNRTHRVSRSPSGDVANGPSSNPIVSDDGRIVVFQSTATNLVPGADANGSLSDIYVYDSAGARTRRVSVDAAGVQSPAGSSGWPALSADGRFLTFVSSADLTASGDRHGRSTSPIFQLYLRDLGTHLTTRISTSANGASANNSSERSALSRDGAFVVFVSEATNVAPRDQNRSPDVFLYERMTRAISVVSRSVSGGTANGPSGNPAISADGRFIAFQSQASNLVCTGRCPSPGEDINLVSDIFLLDRQTAVIQRVSAGTGQEWMEESAAPVLDGAGRILAFASRRPIDPQDNAHDFDLFLRLPATGR